MVLAAGRRQRDEGDPPADPDPGVSQAVHNGPFAAAVRSGDVAGTRASRLAGRATTYLRAAEIFSALLLPTHITDDHRMTRLDGQRTAPPPYRRHRIKDLATLVNAEHRVLPECNENGTNPRDGTRLWPASRGRTIHAWWRLGELLDSERHRTFVGRRRELAAFDEAVLTTSSRDRERRALRDPSTCDAVPARCPLAAQWPRCCSTSSRSSGQL